MRGLPVMNTGTANMQETGEELIHYRRLKLITTKH